MRQDARGLYGLLDELPRLGRRFVRHEDPQRDGAVPILVDEDDVQHRLAAAHRATAPAKDQNANRRQESRRILVLREIILVAHFIPTPSMSSQSHASQNES